MSPSANESGLLRATGTATSCVLSTIIGPSGMESDMKPSGGSLAFLDSALRVEGQWFQEDGAITFGDDSEHELRFTTRSRGHLLPSPEPGAMTGTARWEIEGGKGQFADARGFISSAFTLNGLGDLDELHCGMIFIPE